MNRIIFSLLAIVTFTCASLALAGPDEDLLLAIHRGDMTKVSAAIEAGTKVNGKPGDLTPLAVAAYSGQVKIAKYLLKEGADPSISDRVSGVPPSVIAELGGYFELAELLKTVALERLDNAIRTINGKYWEESESPAENRYDEEIRLQRIQAQRRRDGTYDGPIFSGRCYSDGPGKTVCPSAH